MNQNHNYCILYMKLFTQVNYYSSKFFLNNYFHSYEFIFNVLSLNLFKIFLKTINIYFSIFNIESSKNHI